MSNVVTHRVPRARRSGEATSHATTPMTRTPVLPHVSVIVPTRNEQDNIVPLLDRLHAALGGTPADVLFVDDSDDDTPDAVGEASKTYADSTTQVALLHRSSEERVGGLSGAVVSGLRRAQAPWVVVMDADLQHPPEVVPELLKAAADNAADLVVGSRYVGDGDAEGLSSWTRSLVSLGSGRLAKTFFPRRLKHISDPMSGLFLVRREALDLDTFNPIGFKILLEIAVRLAPLKVVEVPFVFAERIAGESKASLQEGVKFARHLVRLKMSASSQGRRMVGVGTVGATGIVVNTAALWVLIESASLSLAIAAIVATQFSTTWNFALSDRLVYRRRRPTSWARSLATFALVNNAVLLLRLPLMSVFIGQLAMDYRLANIATLLLAFAARFAVVDRTIYRGVPA